MNVRQLDTPIKSKSDKKDYRFICLENGLKALLIHHEVEESQEECDDKSSASSEDDACEDENDDEEVENEREKLAAVALAINAGSFSDPENIQGLAHFVEHMIFMGSEKYPKENELDEFLSATGGSSNALTEVEHTLFYFDVVEEHLAEALDRFSSLFISPLLMKDSMSREMEAVESEFQNNINDDDNRLMQLYASKACNVVSTFTWGNLKTLKDQVDAEVLYKAVHDFRTKYYISNNMYLAIESLDSLDNLQHLVEEKFSEIKTGPLLKTPCLTSYDKIFTSNFFDKMLYVKPKGDKCKLYINFVMPSMQNRYKFKPHDYLAYIIQHEGSGSLSSYLKRNLLALHVSAGSEDQSFEGNSMYTLFSIEILLTDKGYENIYDVLQAIFSVFIMLKLTPMTEHKRSYEELKQIRDTSFSYQEEKTSGENTEEYAVNMIYYEPVDIITGPDLFYEFNEEMVKELIDILNGGNFNITLLSDKHQKYPFVEKWFGTEYDEIDMPDQIKTLWMNQNHSAYFHIPEPNKFICSKFDIVYQPNGDHVDTLPEKIDNENNIELWHKLDSKFLLPFGFINCYLESPLTFKSARNVVLTSMYSLIVKYYLSEPLYPAICAGLGYSISAAEKGLLIKLNGYSEKLIELLEIITKELKELANKIESSVFETYRNQCRRNGYNNLINSKFLSKDLRLSILENQHHFCMDQYSMTELITFDELVNFAKAFPNELHVKMMVLGNFDENNALEAAKVFSKNMPIIKSVDESILVSRARKIPSMSKNILAAKSLLPDDRNSIVTNYYQIGKSTIRTQCLIEFIEKVMQEPLFDILRTKEQLGYAVSCSHRVNNGIIGFTITLQVQEDKHPAIKINQRIEAFVKNDFKLILDNFSVEEFDTNKCSLIKLKMMEEVEMENENNRLWSEITSCEYIFNRLVLEAEMIGRLTLDDIKDFYEQILSVAPKLSIQVIGKNQENEKNIFHNAPSLQLLEIEASKNEHIISDLKDFKNSLEIYEEWKTLIDL